ncbi:MAG: ATP-binding protein, partial [Lentisphaeria bacterium]|nr:ATP-binding protein [Lentisphaeria bacterium]
MKMFELAPLIISAFETGGVLIIDELGNSMHPFMAELIIKLFNDPDVNPGKAQLVFTTHNVNLMTPELLRRDQIWFSEKTDGASRFFSLDDFDKRRVTPKSPYGRWYAEGRLGAVPHIDYQGIVRLLGERVDNAEA